MYKYIAVITLVLGGVFAAETKAYDISISFIDLDFDPGSKEAVGSLVRQRSLSSGPPNDVWIEVDLRGIWPIGPRMFHGKNDADSRREGNEWNVYHNDAQNLTNPQRVYAGQTHTFSFGGVYSGVCQDFSSGPIIGGSFKGKRVSTFKRNVKQVRSELFNETLSQIDGLFGSIADTGEAVGGAVGGQEGQIVSAVGQSLGKLGSSATGLAGISTCGSINLTVIKHNGVLYGDVYWPK